MQTTTVQSAPIVIRPMTLLDLPAATELSQEQQWPHRIEDWTLFLKQGEGVTATRDGKVIGTTMGWRFGEDMARIGMVIVSSSAQRQGIGRKLTADMLGRLGDRTVILNATEDGHDLYKQLGFVETGGVRQYQGISKDVPLAELKRGDRVRPLDRLQAMQLLPQQLGARRGQRYGAHCRVKKPRAASVAENEK